VSCPDFFPLGGNSSGQQRWMLMGSYNTYRNSWFPPSRYSIGTFDGLRYTPTSQGILGGDSDYVPKSGADESNHGRRLLCARMHCMLPPNFTGRWPTLNHLRSVPIAHRVPIREQCRWLRGARA
jgi:hypothetical protein